MWSHLHTALLHVIISNQYQPQFARQPGYRDRAVSTVLMIDRDRVGSNSPKLSLVVMPPPPLLHGTGSTSSLIPFVISSVPGLLFAVPGLFFGYSGNETLGKVSIYQPIPNVDTGVEEGGINQVGQDVLSIIGLFIIRL